MFNVICLRTEEVVLSGILDGVLADIEAKRLSETTGKLHQPRLAPIKADWRLREQKKFDDKVYTKVPWHNCTWAKKYPEHFVHVSLENKTFVAFTEDEEKGQRDAQKRIRPGRYLQNFYDDIEVHEIEYWLSEYYNLYDPTDVLFASTPDDIADVYINGPSSSCMSGNKFDTPIHPSYVYGAGDLQVAYLKNDEKYTARALCYPDKKCFGAVYGDVKRITHGLEKLGYNHSYKGWEGAKLLKIIANNKIIAPSIDPFPKVRDAGDHLVLDPDGLLYCANQTGYAVAQFNCAKCTHLYGETLMKYIVDLNQTWCSYCHDRESVPLAMNGETVRWSKSTFDKHGYTCNKCFYNHSKGFICK